MIFDMNRGLRDLLKSSVHRLFVAGQRIGWDVLPRHFYSGIPDVAELSRTDGWRKPSSMVGVAGTDLESQLRFVEQCCSPVRDRLAAGGIHDYACEQNGAAGYGRAEADFLFAFIANKRPHRIVQVGSGVSTAVILLAADEVGYAPEIVCIDPYPTGYLTRIAKEKRIELIPQRAQDAALELLTSMGAGDLLFVDSTHSVRPGGEVNRIILEVLPRLPASAFVHFHDIYFPYDYQADVLRTLFFNVESTLLHAFLIGNRNYSVAASLSMLHHGCPERLQSLLPTYRPAVMNGGSYALMSGSGDFPSAIYLSVSDGQS